MWLSHMSDLLVAGLRSNHSRIVVCIFMCLTNQRSLDLARTDGRSTLLTD